MSEAPQRKRWQRVDGVVLLDKPVGISSNGALQKLRRLYGAAKAGHTGTLDPMASGLLPVCLGDATKFSQMLLDADKGYRARVRLGVKTSTGDAEGEVLLSRPVAMDNEALERAVKSFVGEIDQIPPMYSALKRDGRPLYEYARAGIELARESRRVHIYSLEWSEREGNDFDLQVHCSKGTYVRTLAEDIGESLGCGAHLIGLRRTSIGPFDLERAVTLTALENDETRSCALQPTDLLASHLPVLELSGVAERAFVHGQAVELADVGSGYVRAYGATGFLGLGEWEEGGRLAPRRLVAGAVAGA